MNCVPLSNQIINKDMCLLKVFQPISEKEMMELEYHYFANSQGVNGSRHHNFTERESTRHHMPPYERTQHNLSSCPKR